MKSSQVCLLDVNVLVALSWPSHEAHATVQQWFSERKRERWASCPFTQASFVRILSNPAFSPHALTPPGASALLLANLQHPRHEFWPDNITMPEALALVQRKVVGHQQVTDAYLIGLAIRNKGCLATLDRKFSGLLPEKLATNHLLNVM